MSSYSSLRGRSVFVTGGSRGLGRAMALGLLGAGARVAIGCTGPSRHLDETVARMAAIAPEPEWKVVFGDVGHGDDCERMAAEALRSFGRIDVLINNAGARTGEERLPFWKLSADEWRRISHTNCDSIFFMTRAVIPSMLEHGFGKIVMVSTNRATMVREHFSPYGASKAFLEACARSWARELEATGVTINVLLPGGYVDTSGDLAIGASASRARGLDPSVMVGPALWLAADESNSVSGERFVASRWRPDLPLDERVIAARENSVDLHATAAR